MNNLKEYDMDDNIDDITTRVIKLANGESIVCTCIPSRTDEGSDKLHIIHPLKMEMSLILRKQVSLLLRRHHML